MEPLAARCLHLALLGHLATAASFAAPAGEGERGNPCSPSATTLCLGEGNRYEVTATFDGAAPATPATVLPVASSDWGVFTLDEVTEADLLVRVVDACSFNGYSWVWVLGLSDEAQSVVIRDTVNGFSATYDHVAGEYFAVQDIQAITCLARSGSDQGSTPLRSGSTEFDVDRFQIGIDWQSPARGAGAGNAQPLTATTAHFWFFTPSTPEVLLKMVDRSAVNGNFWLVFSSTVDLEYTVRVEDPCTGTHTYTKPAGTVSNTTIDSLTFPVADCRIFADGFENGDTSAWVSSP